MKAAKSRLTRTRDASVSEIEQKSKEQDSTLEPNGASTDKLMPSCFDDFVPWMCLIYQSPNLVIVTRVYQDEYVKASFRRASAKSVKSGIHKIDVVPIGSSEMFQKSKTVVNVDECIPIKAFYNIQGYLVEVAIVGSPCDINRVVMQVISMTIPYHTLLYKLTISKGGLTATTLVEIGKFLPQSYLTEICLDDTYVPQRNYVELLKVASTLKSLSINRCQIGDDCCKEIAASIETETPGGTLRTLQLGSNKISDAGALAFADVLRRNRQLLHLNLSGNTITDTGAVAILSSLMEFPMKYDEILIMKSKRLEYNRQKIEVYDEYVKEITAVKHRAEGRARSSSKTKSSKFRSNTSKLNKNHDSKKDKRNPEVGISIIEDEEPKRRNTQTIYAYPDLELRAKELIGDFFDTFDANHVIVREGMFYCVGNMFLCSLDLAYNDLGHLTVKKIQKVLDYQSGVKCPPGATGLLRLTIDGNSFPEYSEEYGEIEIFLQRAVAFQLSRAMVSNMSRKKITQSSEMAQPRRFNTQYKNK